MIRIFRYKKSTSLFLILAYLLIGSGIGNAMLWCQESEAFAHLEYNLAGKCQGSCQPAEGNHVSGGQADLSPPSWSSATTECLDTRFSLSHAPVAKARNLLADPVSPGCFVPRRNPLHQLAGAGPVRLNLLALPPPARELVALRTVVLLN